MTLSECARFISVFLLAAAAIATPVAVSEARPAAATREITVSAAISLKDALDEISALYQKEEPGATVRLNLGGSGTLQRQIEQGAPVDLFISASPEEMDALASEGLLLAGTRRDLLKNRVVLIVPVAKSSVMTFQDLTNPGVKEVAIGEPQTVPAGKYAEQVLTHLGLYEKLKSKFVFGKDVRQVLTYIATGNADAGIVYATDAKTSSRVKVVAVSPENWHSPVVYPVAVMKGARNVETAKDFEAFLLGAQARTVFTKYGFVSVE